MAFNVLEVYKLIEKGNLVNVKTLVCAYSLSFIEGWSQGYSSLRDVAKFVRFQITNFLLTEEAEVNSEVPGKITPLHFAVALNEVEITRLLLDRGAEVNATNLRRETPLHRAVCGSKDPQLFQMLIDNGADINVANFLGETPLHIAVESANKEMVLLLCNNHACSQLDCSNFAPLHIACFKRLPSIVKVLLTKSDCSRDCINIALLVASQTGNQRIVTLILDASADPNECSKVQLKHHDHRLSVDAGSTSLLEASERGHLGVVELLLKRGAQANLSRRCNKYTPLHAACENGYFEIADLLLKAGAESNAKASDHTTPLLLAAQNGHLKIVKLLLKHGAYVNCSRLPDKFAPLHFASSRADFQIVGALLDCPSADINIKTNEGMTPLHLAAVRGCVPTVLQLLNHSADVNAQTCEGSTPLHFAAEKRNKAVFGILLTQNVDVNIKDKNNVDPLYVAVRTEDSCFINSILKFKPNMSSEVIGAVACSIPNDFGDNAWIDDLIEYCISSGCEIMSLSTVFNAAVNFRRVNLVKTLVLNGFNSKVEGFCSDCLHLAVKKGYKEIAELLLASGWNANAKDSSGNVPIHYAVQYFDEDKCAEIVQLLLDNGANIIDAPLLLFKAVIRNCFAVCKKLIENGADVNFKDEEGRTALHFAAKRGVHEIACLLIKSGADVNSCDRNDGTPLHFAVEYGSEKVTRVLLSSRVNVDSRQRDGCTPLHIASKKGDSSVIPLLLKAGADVNSVTSLNETALHLASHGSSVETVSVLLEEGIDINVEDSSGRVAAGNFNWTQQTSAFRKQVIKLKVAELFVHDKIKSDFDNQRFDAPRLRLFQQKCEEEVMKMKRRKYSSHFSLYDVVKNQQNPAFARNEPLVKSIVSVINENFPVYRSLILICLKKSKLRVDLLTTSQMWLSVLLTTSNALNESKYPVLPVEILEKIVILLDNEDLKSLIVCGENLKNQLRK